MVKTYFVHDKTFKAVMADIRVARDFFEEYLPEEILAITNLNTLKLDQNTFIDEDLNEFRSDVLYEVNLNNGNMAYLLCEHLSSVDSLMPFRLLNYMVKIWHLYLQQTGNEYLPFIFPLVFYNGKKPYKGSRTLSELIQGPSDLIQEALLKPFHLIDTHDIKEKDLRKRRWAGALTFMFKHAHAADIWPFIQPALKMLRNIQEESGAVIFINHLLKYWLLVGEMKEKGPKDFIETIQQGLSIPIGGEVMTIAEQLRQEGRQEGIQEGVAGYVIRQLEHKFKFVPEYYKKQVKQASPEHLLTWGDKILDSTVLEEVFNT